MCNVGYNLHEMTNITSLLDAPIKDDCSSLLMVSKANRTHQTTNASIMIIHGTPKQIYEITITISLIALIVSFVVYATLPQLRTIPGKCLMGMIVSEFFTNLFVIAASNTLVKTQQCILIAVFLHYFFLSSLTWTSIIGKLITQLQIGN